jgi:DNA repair protein RadD
MLLDRKSRNELIPLLPPDDARGLAHRLALRNGDSPYAALGQLRIRSGSAAASDLLEFFGLVPIVEEPDETVPSEEAIMPRHGLFPHQRVAAMRVLGALRREPHRVLLHMPTGSGKTRTAMNVMARLMAESEPFLAIWLAHSEELCEQAAQEFAEAWKSLGDRRVGLHRWWGDHRVEPEQVRDGLLVAGLAKAYSAAQRSTEEIGVLAGRAGLVIMDEAHQAVAPTYQRILELIAQSGVDTPLLGLTATPGRTWSDIDEDERLSEFFFRRKVALEVEGFASPIDYLVADGYLAETVFRPLYHRPGFELTSKDRAELEETLEIPPRILQQLAEDEQRNLKIVTTVEALTRSHSRLIVFAATVEHARLIATVLRARGTSAAAVTGATPREERAQIIGRFRDESESPQVLVNFGVLTAGFDAPQTSAALIARPTQSLVLFSQMVGRATRGPRAGGNSEAEIVTVVDTNLPGFASLAESFENWEDVWKQDS